MNCPEIQQELDAYRRSELEPGVIAAIDRHLAGCADCRGELRALELLTGALAALPRWRAERPLYPGRRPAHSLDRAQPVSYTTVESPIGPLGVVYRNRRILLVTLDPVDDATLADRMTRRVGHTAQRVDEPPAWLVRTIAEAFAGRRARYLPIDLSGLNAFDRAVLEKAREIPPGEVRTYAWIAREIGHPGAVRAVGTALGQNPIPFLVPCHRVVRSDLSLGGYAFGPALKQQLLEREGLPAADLTRWVREGTRFAGSRTSKIFCFPTCYTGRRLKDQHRVSFRSEAEARAAGYRPCKVCRPASPAQAVS